MNFMKDGALSYWGKLAGLSGVVLIAAILRLWGLEAESPYFDELASLRHLGASDLPTYLSGVRSSDPPMTPVYFVLQYYWAEMTGGTVYAMRLLSVLCSLACLPLLFYLGELFYGVVGAFASSLLFSLSLSQIYYAQEIRPYALVLLLSLTAALSLYLAVERNSRSALAVNILANHLLMWTHFFTTLFLFAQGCWLLLICLQTRRFRRGVLWVLSYAPSLVLLAWWIYSIDREVLESVASWRYDIPHTYLQLLGSFLLFSGSGASLFRDMPTLGGVAMGAIMWRFFALMAVAAVTFTAIHRFRPQLKTGGLADSRPCGVFMFLLLLTAVPPAALFLLSACVYSCYSSRYALYSSLPFLLLIGGAAVALAPRVKLRWTLLAALAAVCGLNLGVYGRPLRSDFGAAAVYLSEQAEPLADKLIVFHYNDGLYALRANGRLPADRFPMVGLSLFAEVEQELSSPEERRNREWLVVYQNDISNSQMAALDNRLTERGGKWKRRTFGKARPVHVYLFDNVAEDATQGSAK